MMMDNELMPASGLLGSVGDLGNNSDSLRIYTSMPVLEDGLSSGHASDTDNNNPTVMLMKRQINEIEKEIIQRTRNDMLGTNENDSGKDVSLNVTKDILHTLKTTSPDLFIAKKENSYDTNELQLDGLDPLGTPPPPAPQGRQSVSLDVNCGEVEAAIKDIRMALQRTKTLPVKSPSEEPPEPSVSPIWIPRYFTFCLMRIRVFQLLKFVQYFGTWYFFACHCERIPLLRHRIYVWDTLRDISVLRVNASN